MATVFNIRKGFIFGFLAFVLMLVVAGSAQAEEPTVESVSVSIKSNTVSPPVRVAKRMELSVSTVGDQVLVGRKITDITENRESYEKLIKEVFDRVLVGYSVQRVEIKPGRTSQITVQISPWGEVVREVKLDIDYGGASADAVILIKQDLGNIDERINELLLGMPVDSVDWAGGITKTVVREYLAAQLPEYRANLEITPGQVTNVKLSLIPAGTVIRGVKVTLRSHSIPNVLLLTATDPLEEAAGKLRNLPVEFVERHRSYYDNALVAAVAQRPFVKQYGFKLKSELNPGVETDVAINVETHKFKITLEGYLDVGRTEDNASAKLHIGKYVSKREELFLETTFIPGSVTWDFAAGWGHRLNARTELGVKYQLNESQTIFWMNQELGGRWSLRLERTPASGRDEVGIRYKLHDFISAEYVFTNNDRWLRLVGNL